MGMVDFSSYKMNPWESYEKNRDYLLRRAGLEEDVAARKQRGDIANRNLSLGYDQLGLSKSRLAETKRSNIADEGVRGRNASVSEERQRQEESARKQETIRRRATVMGSLLANANEENWSDVRKYGMEKNTQEIQAMVEAGIIPREEGEKQIEAIESIVPEDYDQNFADFMILAETENAKKAGLENAWVYNKESDSWTLRSYRPGDQIALGKGEVPGKYLKESRGTYDGDEVNSKWTDLTAGQKQSEVFKYYNMLTKSYLDPLTNDVKDGPDNDPEKYRVLHDNAVKMMAEDLRSLRKNEKPSFLKEPKDSPNEQELPKVSQTEALNYMRAARAQLKESERTIENIRELAKKLIEADGKSY